jgi:hypothetical protein
MRATDKPQATPKDLLAGEDLLGFCVRPASGDEAAAVKLVQVKSGTTKTSPAPKAG